MTTREELLALIQAHHLDEPRYRWRLRLAELAAYPGSVHYTRRVLQLNAALEFRVQNGWS